MEKNFATLGEHKFRTPEDEVNFLRNELAELKEKQSSENFESRSRDLIQKYHQTPIEKIIPESKIIKSEEQGKLILDLAPEEHDNQIEELIKIAEKKGIKNALAVLEKMKNPHLTDDFHRFLVQYLKSGLNLSGVKEGGPIWRPSHMTLYEIALPDFESENANMELKRLVSGMEQFYAGLSSGLEKEEVFSIEIAKSFKSEQFIFYTAVPTRLGKLFAKQIGGLFAGAEIREVKEDYNIFNPNGVSLGSIGRQQTEPILPLKTYEYFNLDPLSVLLKSFSKIDHRGEGASIQIVLKPASGEYLRSWKKVLTDLEQGRPFKKSIKDHPVGLWGEISKEFLGFISPEKKNKKEDEESKPKLERDEKLIEAVREKISSPVMVANLRLVASSVNYDGAEEILRDLESAFSQFENTIGNRLRFTRLKEGRLREFFEFYSWRLFNPREPNLLNIKELTTIFHFPTTDLKDLPELKRAETSFVRVPTGMEENNPESPIGIILGLNRGSEGDRRVLILPEDRMRHFYVIGQTGTGKTTLLKNMIVQDIKNGEGVCMIDPHGSDIDDILANIPKDRFKDVIYFDPARVDRPMGLNMLEFDKNYPEQKTFVVNEMLAIFEKLFDMKTAGGPIFEQYFRNSVLLTLEDPETGNTLLDVSRVLADKAYRTMKLSQSKNPIVNQFWREVAEKAGGEASLQNVVPYITSKFDNFLSNDIMRPIIAQGKSAFNFREIMDSGKILLVNLSKGRLGDLNSHLIGLIIVGKILMASLSRVGAKDMRPFHLYIDEFQNITTDSIAVILSEARKYKLGLNIAHQFIDQLSDKIKSAVFGNVGTIASFRVGSTDAEFLAKQFEPVFSAQDLSNLPNRHACLKLLYNGFPKKPFSLETLAPEEGNSAIVQDLKDLSALEYGRSREEIEGEINKRYQI